MTNRGFDTRMYPAWNRGAGRHRPTGRRRDGLANFVVPTITWPSAIIAWARSRDAASPRFTISASARSGASSAASCDTLALWAGDGFGWLAGSRTAGQITKCGGNASGIKPVIDRTFPLAELAEAFRHQESQKHFGKICVAL